jgi:hypothetical protein
MAAAVGCEGTFPETLSETALYTDGDPAAISEGVIEFAPRFQLWTDGAKKKRWLQIPDGQQIDTSDGDLWIFPEGTRLWKEFSRDDLRIETRILEKIGPEPGDWEGATYAWNDDDTEATQVGSRGEENARGTAHDIPEGYSCEGCHAGGTEWPLGVSLVQLSSGGDAIGLQALLDADAISDTLPTVTLPGDEATQAALGYLHANCGSCHYDAVEELTGLLNLLFGPGAPTDFSMKLIESQLETLEDTGVHRTAIDHELTEKLEGATVRLVPGDADKSAIAIRMGTRGDDQMPLIGTEEVDEEGLAIITDWINSL